MKKLELTWETDFGDDTVETHAIDLDKANLVIDGKTVGSMAQFVADVIGLMAQLENLNEAIIQQRKSQDQQQHSNLIVKP